MNVFRFELRSLRINTLLWLLGLTALICIYISVYPSFAHDAEATRKLFGSFPAAVRSALGFNPETLFSFLGFLGNIFSIILLAAAIHGIGLGLGLFSHEQRTKTTDFLFSKPRRRQTLFTAKLCAGLVIVAVTTIWVMAVTCVMSRIVGAGDYDLRLFFMVTGVFGMIELWFFSVGLLLSQVIHKIKTVPPIALGVAFGLFLVGTVGSFIDADKTRWVAPAKYVDFSYVVEHGHYELQYLAVGAGIILISLVTGFFIYTRRDVASLT